MKINRQRVYDKYEHSCAYCGNYIQFKDMQVDHMTPKALINADNYYTIHHIDNLMPSCRTCNHYKRGETLQAFRVKMKTLHGRIRNIYINKVAEKYGIITIAPFDGRFYFEKPENERNLPF